MAVAAHLGEELVGHRAALAVGALHAAEHVPDLVGVVAAQVNDRGDRLLRHRAHVGELAAVHDVGAVLGDEAQLVLVPGKVVAQLPVLVAARHHKVAARSLHARQEALEARDVVGVVGAHERAVDVNGNELDVRRHDEKNLPVGEKDAGRG